MVSEKLVMAVIRAARPTFRNDHDKATFAVHASFLAAGYVLVAAGPDCSPDAALSFSSSDEVGIEYWNELENEYTFLYVNPERHGKKVFLNCLKINNKLLVYALATLEPVHLEIGVEEYVAENGGSNYSTQFKNLDKLVKNLNEEFLTKLDGPSSSKESSSGKSWRLQKHNSSKVNSEEMANEKSVMAVIRAARPTFRNDHDKATFAVHASFLAAGYVLVAAGPDAFSDTALSSSSTDEVGIEHWNELDDEYAFLYVNPERGGKKVLLKCLKMNNKLLVDALADGASEPVHLEIDVEEYAAENGGSNYSTQFKNLDKLVKNLNEEFLTKLDGSSSSKESSSSKSSRLDIHDEPRRDISQPDNDLSEPTRVPVHPSGIIYPPVNPIGGSDLFVGPGAGVYPTRGDFGSGGSMLLGPNDPRWFGGMDGQLGFPGGPPGVPPGARFDPFGPPGVPGFEPSRFARNPRRPPGGTHPDLEHFGDGSGFI